jgi:hypothetical protein
MGDPRPHDFIHQSPADQAHPIVTEEGRFLTDDDIDRLANGTDRGYDITDIAMRLREPEPEPVAPPVTAPVGPPRSLVELATSGLLWLINASVFHPRGYALALVPDDDGNYTTWQLHGDGSRPWQFDMTLAEQMMDASWNTLNEQVHQ